MGAIFNIEEIHEYYKNLINTVSNYQDYLFFYDRKENYAYISKELERQFSFPGREFSNALQYLEQNVIQEDMEKLEKYYRDVDNGTETELSIVIRCVLKTGRMVWIRHKCHIDNSVNKNCPVFIGSMQEVGQKRIADNATGVYTEEKLFEDYEVFCSEQENPYGALMKLGIDNLREINATNGMEMGDLVVNIVATTVAEIVGRENVYRLEGSDIFLLFLKKCQSEQQAKNVYERIQKQINDHCRQIQYRYFFTVSAGIVLFPEVSKEIKQLHTYVGYALNRAKENGKNCYSVYDRKQFLQYREKLHLQRRLQLSVTENFKGFNLFYQPIVDLEKKQMTGAEALLRWNDEEYPKTSPAEFVPLLEESGLMVPVGRFIMEEAMRQQVLWEKEQPGFCMHINLSYVQFQRGDLLEQVRTLIEKTGVNPENIVFEITESGFIGSDTTISSELSKLKNMGFQIALDDFGTGYSNFVYLTYLHVDIVKLDRVFVNGALNDPAEMNLLSHIIETVHAIGMKVCLEGLEQANELKAFERFNVQFIQGYVFGIPVASAFFQKNFTELTDQKALKEHKQYKTTDETMTSLVKDMRSNEKKHSLLQRAGRSLSLWLSALVLVAILGFSLMSWQFWKQILVDQLQSNMKTELASVVDMMESKITNTESMVQNLGNYVLYSHNSLELEDYEQMLLHLVERRTEIAGAGIWFEPYAFRNREITSPYAYHDGDQCVLTDYYGSPEYDYFSQEYYARTKDVKVPTITGPYFDETMNKQLITFASPLIDEDGVYLGCVTVDLYVENLENAVENIHAGHAGYAFLLDTDGSYICGFGESPFDEQSIAEIEDQERQNAAMNVLRQEDGTVEYDAENQSYRVFFDTIDKMSWTMGIRISEAELYKPVNRLFVILVLTVGGTITLALLVILGVIHAYRATQERELNQQKLLNRAQFKALQSSYFLIMSVNADTGALNAIYRSPYQQSYEVDMTNYDKFISDSLSYVHTEDLEEFKSFNRMENIREALKLHDHICLEARTQLHGLFPEWTEITVSRIENGTLSEKKKKFQGNEFLYMVRDIHERKSHETTVDEENARLLEQMKEMNEKLFQMSITDKLTQAYNRDGLEFYAEELVKQASQPGHKLFVLVSDLDKLKRINDTYGHLRGDAAIKLIAEVFMEIDVAKLLCARIGGDEFMLMGALPDEDELPERILEGIHERLIEKNKNSGLPIPVNISVGYYWGPPDEGTDLDHYVDVADRNMYDMKNGEP
ncbi:MAG: EAL domain-containing protein [Lachnospiraceae bacterium]|nr:EAL domain-containing protein [Lachnospiraceae bacterium]